MGGLSDAIKVLSGMVDIRNVSLIEFYEKKLLALEGMYLAATETSMMYFIKHFRDAEFAFLSILASFLIILAFKNSSQMMKGFSSNILTLSLNVLLFVFSIYIISAGTYTEFLYFNF